MMIKLTAIYCNLSDINIHTILFYILDILHVGDKVTLLGLESQIRQSLQNAGLSWDNRIQNMLGKEHIVVEVKDRDTIAVRAPDGNGRLIFSKSAFNQSGKNNV